MNLLPVNTYYFCTWFFKIARVTCIRTILYFKLIYFARSFSPTCAPVINFAFVLAEKISLTVDIEEFKISGVDPAICVTSFHQKKFVQ